MECILDCTLLDVSHLDFWSCLWKMLNGNLIVTRKTRYKMRSDNVTMVMWTIAALMSFVTGEFVFMSSILSPGKVVNTSELMTMSLYHPCQIQSEASVNTIISTFSRSSRSSLNHHFMLHRIVNWEFRKFVPVFWLYQGSYTTSH